MRLLICTQVVDKNHPILGFFHRWLEEFAAQCSEVHVIALEVGEYDLPENVTVHSLGKESKPASTAVYSWRLASQVWRLRKGYDRVLVHMIPEYVLAGAPVWWWSNKPVSLWYTHGSVRLPLRLAALFVTHIFTAAKEGMNLHSQKVIVTGHGVETTAKQNVTRDLDLITVGRISPAKNLHELIDIVAAVQHQLPKVRLTIIGAAPGVVEQKYQSELKEHIASLHLADAVTWVGPVPHTEVRNWLSRTKVFVHTAQNGSLDKVLLEALAAGTPTVTSAPGAKSLPLGMWQVQDRDAFVEQIVTLQREYPTNQIASLQQYVAEHHGLDALIKRLCDHIK